MARSKRCGSRGAEVRRQASHTREKDDRLSHTSPPEEDPGLGISLVLLVHHSL